MASKMYQTPNLQSFLAGADLSGKQYTFVKFHTVVGEVVAVSSASDIPCGILMNAPEDGETADVAMPGGGAWLICDASVVNGSFISTGADGKGELATGTSGKFIAAIADAIGSGGTSSSDRVPVMVCAFEAAREAQDIMTTQGDLVRGGASGVPERVALGAANTFLQSDGTDAAWSTQTLTLGGNFSTVGAYACALTLTAGTALTLPTTGTLATLAGSETLTNKTATALVLDGGVTASGAPTDILDVSGVASATTFAKFADTKGATVSANGMTADPETAAEAGYVAIDIDGTAYQIPIYAA